MNRELFDEFRRLCKREKIDVSRVEVENELFEFFMYGVQYGRTLSRFR